MIANSELIQFKSISCALSGFPCCPFPLQLSRVQSIVLPSRFFYMQRSDVLCTMGSSCQEIKNFRACVFTLYDVKWNFLRKNEFSLFSCCYVWVFDGFIELGWQLCNEWTDGVKVGSKGNGSVEGKIGKGKSDTNWIWSQQILNLFQKNMFLSFRWFRNVFGVKVVNIVFSNTPTTFNHETQFECWISSSHAQLFSQRNVSITFVSLSPFPFLMPYLLRF